MRYKVIVGCLCAILVGCTDGRQKIDSSSEAAFEDSIKAIVETLSDEKREEVAAIFVETAMSNPRNAAGRNSIFLALGSVLDGKDADQLAQYASDRMAERRARQLQAIDSEIDRLELEISTAESDAELASSILSSVHIENERYYWTAGRIRSEPVIAFRITNNSDIAIKRIFAHGLLETPGRSVPWVSEDFNYSIKGGLEPGETLDLELAPGSYGPWGSVDLKDRKDMVFTVTLPSIEKADGERVSTLDADSIAKSRERLALLKERARELSP